MKIRIIYLFVILAAITACSDQYTFIEGPATDLNGAPVTYYPSLDYAFIEQTDVIFPESATSCRIKVESSCDWTCVSDCDWISVEKNGDGESITISVAENNVSPTRSGKIVFYNDDKLLSSSSVVQAASPANCHIISEVGTYAFSAVKGNTEESLDATESVEVLWETYGTTETPEKGSLIKSAIYQNGIIVFTTSDKFREGNAVIAAKDGNGKILWSWHIWLTDQPQEQVYYNNAGTLMDRNLGATSATPGDVGALGLMYQWGRKDPFLGAANIGNKTFAASTIKWPSSVTNNIGTLEYTISHPTTYVQYFNNSDKLVLWTVSGETKSVYDPCPAGWRIPDGDVWAKASASHGTSFEYDRTNEGANFSGIFGSDDIIWYPAAGIRWADEDALALVGAYGNYWSSSLKSSNWAYILYFYEPQKDFEPQDDTFFGYANSVRCAKDN